MISRMFAEFLEEIKRLGGMLSPEQEFALDEAHKEFKSVIYRTYKFR